MKAKLILSFALISMLFASPSCKKGDDGPIGPAGPTGPQGPAGSPNVIYTAWFQATSWVKDTIFNIYDFSYVKTIPEITQKIIDSGTVLTFGKLLGYNPQIWPVDQIGQLPLTLTYKTSSAGETDIDTWQAAPYVGNIRIHFTNNQNYYDNLATNHQFRCIIIPGGVKSTAGTRLHRSEQGDIESNSASLQTKNGQIDFTKMSYEEVCAYFKIAE